MQNNENHLDVSCVAALWLRLWSLLVIKRSQVWKSCVFYLFFIISSAAKR